MSVSMARNELVSSRLKTQGLVWAYRFDEQVECAREIVEHDLTADYAGWLHFNLADRRTRPWLERHAHLSQAALDALTLPGPQAGAQQVDDGFVLVLFDAGEQELKLDPESFGALHLYFDATRVISARTRALHCADVLRREFAEGHAAHSSGELVERLVQSVADNFAATVRQAGDDVDDVEDVILSEQLQDQGRHLGRLRRLLARLRRHLAANRSTVAGITALLSEDSEEEQRERFVTLARRLESVAQDLDLVQERGRLLQEEIAARLNEQTNRNLYVLAVVTTVMLPVTLVTGMLGMNVSGLPWGNSEHGFLWMCGVMFAVAALVLRLMRKARMV
ncbi:MAG: CorA family divalent cation transporter [Myxococcales bacterium]